jgi:hypothetical protein
MQVDLAVKEPASAGEKLPAAVASRISYKGDQLDDRSCSANSIRMV